jgi:hypothetical protein
MRRLLIASSVVPLLAMTPTTRTRHEGRSQHTKKPTLPLATSALFLTHWAHQLQRSAATAGIDTSSRRP